jgi:peptidoglycan/LPS O-acetylase OafA/YrhL
LTNGLLIAVLASGTVLLFVALIFYRSIEVGPNWTTFPGGFCRVVYSFFVGVAVYRFWLSTSFRLRTHMWLVVIALLAVFAAPFSPVSFPMLAVLILFPAIVFVGACSEPPKWADPICAQLGATSYAVYALHIPLLSLVIFAVEKRQLFASPNWVIANTHPSILTSPLTVSSVLILAWFLDRYYDAPVRTWLTGRQ